MAEKPVAVAQLRRSAEMLVLRALVAFLALPGMVAGVVPAWLTANVTVDRDTLPVAVVVMAIGAVLLLWCVRDFLVSGRGTLAPWDPPRHLVVVGLYHFVRNPMYLAVLTMLAGWALLYPNGTQIGYFFACIVIFHLRVVHFEEPSVW